MKYATATKIFLIVGYILIGTGLFRQSAYCSLLSLTIALAMVAPRKGFTVTFATLRIRIALSFFFLGLSMVLLAFEPILRIG
ncbi:MAG: hypothetical protein HY255_11150 [Betaproteobacteria bacterium]|nr:hypothetical protein [Betaproteobacteria bacterium]